MELADLPGSRRMSSWVTYVTCGTPSHSAIPGGTWPVLASDNSLLQRMRSKFPIFLTAAAIMLDFGYVSAPANARSLGRKAMSAPNVIPTRRHCSKTAIVLREELHTRRIAMFQL